MEIQRCPVCGWPAPKGRPCPRGCGRLPVDYPAQPAPQAPTYAQPQFAQPDYAQPPQAATIYASAAPAEEAAPQPAIQAVPAVPAPEPPASPDRRATRQRAAGPSGLGGWLVLPIIGLAATLCLSVWSLLWNVVPMFRSDTWTKLTSPSSETYHWLWQPWMMFDAFTLVVMVLGSIALLMMILRKRRSVPRYAVIFYTFCIVAIAFDVAAGMVVLVDWLHAAGLDAAADTVRLASLRNCGQALVLAAVWIPYFLRSKRVRNTFVEPRPAETVDPASLTAADQAKPGGRRRVSAALVVLIIIIVAGGAVFALNMYETSAAETKSAPASGSSSSSEAVQLMTQAEAAYKAGSLDRALSLYDRALQSDPGYEPAYYGKWNILVETKDYSAAKALAEQATQRFATSRLAWFDLGFAQEALNDLPGAQASYTTCLKFPEPAAGTSVGAGDATVRKRLDLVAYVVSISAPRQAVAGAIDAVNKALAQQPPDDAALAAATSQAGATLDTNMAALEQVTAPGYFAEFHAGMLAAYRDIKAACSDVAVAVAGKDATAVSGAQKELNDAIDRFNQNDATGTSLMQSYYAQTPSATVDTVR